MSQMRGNNSQRSAEDTWVNFLDSAGRFLFFAGILGTIAGAGFLLFYIFAFGSSGAAGEAQALSTIGLVSKFLLPSVVATAVGSSIMFWGEETLGVVQLIGAAILYVVPKFLVSEGSGNKVQLEAAATLQGPGLILGVIGLFVVGFEVISRIRGHLRDTEKNDKLKFGKGVKQENVQNVFMGKCWQLPYCKKFVRERCPIFVAQTTCWSEGTGCMCDEQVIKGAMEGKLIPKDAISAKKMIPRNTKLTDRQKKDRCSMCVIYNEHQKHKYKVAMPLAILTPIVVTALMYQQFLDVIGGLILGADKAMTTASLGHMESISKNASGVGIFQWLVLGCGLLIVVAYMCKLVEWLVYTYKI